MPSVTTMFRPADTSVSAFPLVQQGINAWATARQPRPHSLGGGSAAQAGVGELGYMWHMSVPPAVAGSRTPAVEAHVTVTELAGTSNVFLTVETPFGTSARALADEISSAVAGVHGLVREPEAKGLEP